MLQIAQRQGMNVCVGIMNGASIAHTRSHDGIPTWCPPRNVCLPALVAAAQSFNVSIKARAPRKFNTWRVDSYFDKII